MTRSEKGEGSLVTRLKIAGLVLACFLIGWLFGSNPASPGASSAERWVMTGPGNMILLNTRTGNTWIFRGNKFTHMPEPPAPSHALPAPSHRSKITNFSLYLRFPRL